MEEIEVSYEAVESCVDRIWQAKPRFVIHVGVAGRRPNISLETKSFNGCYNLKDALGKVGISSPSSDNPLNVDGPGDCFLNVFKFLINFGINSVELQTDIDLVECLACCPTKFPVELSDDPGNYLCGYIYYKSLQKVAELRGIGARVSTLFIHVPIIQTVPSETVAECLLSICNHLIEKYSN